MNVYHRPTHRIDKSSAGFYPIHRETHHPISQCHHKLAFATCKPPHSPFAKLLLLATWYTLFLVTSHSHLTQGKAF